MKDDPEALGDLIEYGDVFVGMWGSRKRINVFVATKHKSSMLRFVRQSGTEETTWHKYRNRFGRSWRNKGTLRFVGNVPEGWRAEVTKLMKEGRPSEPA